MARRFFWSITAACIVSIFIYPGFFDSGLVEPALLMQPPQSAEAQAVRGLEGTGLSLPLLFKERSRIDSTGESLLISEVLYDPLGPEPGSEWIEIFNPSWRTVDLTHVKVGDEETAAGGEGMLRFPPGERLLPGHVLVIANKATEFYDQHGFQPDYEMNESDPFIPTMVRYASWATGNVVLLNTSEEVLILGDQDQLVDAVSWGGSAFAFDPPAPDVAAGHSLERLPAQRDDDTAMDWTDQPLPGPGEVNTMIPSPTPVPPTETPVVSPSPGVPTITPTPFDGSLLISEVLYDPSGSEPGMEWIELYNPGAADLALAQFKVGDEEQEGGGEGMYRFPEAETVAAGQVLVIAVNAVDYQSEYGVYPDFELLDSDPAVPDLAKYTDWAAGSLSLGNGGDEVLILNGANQLVDALSWGSSDFAFSPPAPDVGEGHSLERRPADQDTDSAGDWIEQPSPDPGLVNLDPPPAPTPTPDAGPSATPPPAATATPTPENTPQSTETPMSTSTPAPATPTGMPTAGSTPTPIPTLVGTMTPTAQVSSTPDPEFHLLISEVFYDTPGTDSQEEWIEIYNPGSVMVDLSGYKIGDEEAQGGSEGMFQFPAGAGLAPGGKVVVALQAVGFAALHGQNPDFEIQDSDPGVPDMLSYGIWGSGTIAMSNGGDEVLLLDGQDLPVDVVVYENGGFAGVIAHAGVSTGHSLERWPPDQDTDDCSLDFIDQETPNPGV